MPYIKQIDRTEVEMGKANKSAGELNYLITRIIQAQWINSARRYQDINDILGALEGAKAEFYRRIVVPYEENKIKENGDVY